MITQVLKRNGSVMIYDPQKIRIAIQKANKEVEKEQQADDEVIDQLIVKLESEKSGLVNIEEIQDFIETYLI
jgi:anaerobic ribonucleoside-triphosphate reductase